MQEYLRGYNGILGYHRQKIAAGGGSPNALRDWLTLPLRAVGPRRFFRRLKVYLCIR